MPGIFLQWAPSTSHWVSTVLRGHAHGSYRVRKPASSMQTWQACLRRACCLSWLCMEILDAKGKIHSNCSWAKSGIKLNPLTKPVKAVCCHGYQWPTSPDVSQCIYQLQTVSHFPRVRLGTHVLKLQVFWQMHPFISSMPKKQLPIFNCFCMETWYTQFKPMLYLLNVRTIIFLVKISGIGERVVHYI